MFRTWNMKFLDLWQQSFHPGCQSCILLVYMISLWDVGIRSEINYQDTFFEIWRKNFDLFVKTALYVSKGTFWAKKQIWKFWFFSNSSGFWTNIHCAWRKKFRQGYQSWKLQSASHKIKQKIKLLKNLFFFKIFRTLNEHLPCLAKKFWARVSQLKIVLFVFRVSIWG